MSIAYEKSGRERIDETIRLSAVGVVSKIFILPAAVA